MLTENQVNFLKILLTLSDKLVSCDSSVDADIDTLNSFQDLTVDDINQLRETIFKSIDAVNVDNRDFINSRISKISFLDGNLLNVMLQIRMVDVENKTDLRNLINQIVDSNMQFVSNAEEFMIYRWLVKFAILEGSAEMIEKTLTKLSSL